MKSIFALVFTIASLTTFAQSESFLTFKESLDDAEDVVSFKVGGFVLRTALWLSGESDFKEEFGEVQSVRFMVVPMEELDKRNLKVSGFKRVLRNDHFEEMVSASEEGDRITVYMQERGKNKNLYFVLIEGEDEIAAIEIKGYLDPKKLIESNSKEKLTSL
jgi:hypothetical protein